MKLFTIAISAMLFLSAFNFKGRIEENTLLSCVLTVNKTTFKVGEVPKPEVKITNNSNGDIYLVGSLDNSADKRRMPYCYYSIDKPRPDTILFYGCGTANPLRVEDFKVVKSREAFNPFESIDNHGFFPDYASTQKETFRNPGIYKIQFHYSTNDVEIEKFRGSISAENWAKHYDTTAIYQLFAKVPKIELVSNTIEIEIRE
jgi:hypothetical protein